MTRRSIATPTAPATRKASGNAIGERPLRQRRRQQALHDEGRVGAEHHHFAMRHVDDAHDAEGDREADRGEQQHRRRRDAVPEVLQRRSSKARRVLIAASAASRGGLERGIVGLGGDFVDQALRVLVAARLQASRWPRARSALGALRIEREDRRARLAQGRRRRADRSPWRVAPRAPASALASRDLNTASAAAMRFCGSGLARVSAPSAASIARRSALLTRTFLKDATSTPVSFSPVLALITSPALGAIDQNMRDRIDQQAIVAERLEDRRRIRRRRWPRVRRSPVRCCGNLSSRNFASASSSASARARGSRSRGRRGRRAGAREAWRATLVAGDLSPSPAPAARAGARYPFSRMAAEGRRLRRAGMRAIRALPRAASISLAALSRRTCRS